MFKLSKGVLASVAVASVVIGAAGVASAEASYPNFGANIGYSRLSLKQADFDTIKLGVVGRFHKYVGAEADLAFGLGDDSVKVSGTPVKTKLKNTYGAYVVGYLPISDQLELNARFGFAKSEFSGKLNGVKALANSDAKVYGVGAQYNFTENDGVRGNYNRYDYDKGGEGNEFSVSYIRKF